MRQVSTIVSELPRIFPRYEFEKPRKRHEGNYYTGYFAGRQQLIELLFARIGRKDSLREIKTSLNVHHRLNRPWRRKILSVFWPTTLPRLLKLSLIFLNRDGKLNCSSNWLNKISRSNHSRQPFPMLFLLRFGQQCAITGCWHTLNIKLNSPTPLLN